MLRLCTLRGILGSSRNHGPRRYEVETRSEVNDDRSRDTDQHRDHDPPDGSERVRPGGAGEARRARLRTPRSRARCSGPRSRVASSPRSRSRTARWSPIRSAPRASSRTCSSCDPGSCGSGARSARGGSAGAGPARREPRIALGGSPPGEIISLMRDALSPASVALERRHRQPGVLELLPVELGGLPLAGPDDRLAGGVDLVGERDGPGRARPRGSPGRGSWRRGRRCCGCRLRRSPASCRRGPNRARRRAASRSSPW